MMYLFEPDALMALGQRFNLGLLVQEMQFEKERIHSSRFRSCRKMARSISFC